MNSCTRSAGDVGVVAYNFGLWELGIAMRADDKISSMIGLYKRTIGNVVMVSRTDVDLQFSGLFSTDSGAYLQAGDGG